MNAEALLSQKLRLKGMFMKRHVLSMQGFMSAPFPVKLILCALGADFPMISLLQHLNVKFFHFEKRLGHSRQFLFVFVL